MPEIGEIEKYRYKGIGRTKSTYYHIWLPCNTCGKPKWFQCNKNGIFQSHATGRCPKCGCGIANKNRTGEKSNLWKGGIHHCGGYILLRLESDSFFYSMTNVNGYVPEHRLVMAKQLGRCLHPWEIVHHKGVRFTGIENRSDNLIDNLELCDKIGTHIKQHVTGYNAGYRKGYQDGQSKSIKELKAEIRLLRWELKQQQVQV